MTRKQIADMVKTIAEAVNLPWCYHHFSDPQEPPYLIYLTSRADFYADDQNYNKIARVALEFYFDNKEPEIEQQIEALLPTAYSVSQEIFLETENMYEIIFEMEVPLEDG